MVIAIDPDIPEDRQRMFFRSSAAAGWVLDGRELGTSSLVSWNPVPGRHELSISGPDEAVADRLSFEVR
jgi:penicillin-binding protein 1C